MTERELYVVRDLHRRIRELETHLATLRRQMYASPKLDGLPRAKSISSQVERITVEIIENDRELESLNEQILSATAKLTGEIVRNVTDLQERTVLILRYVSCLSFNEIACRLDCSERTIFRLHRAGLEKLSVACQ